MRGGKKVVEGALEGCEKFGGGFEGVEVGKRRLAMLAAARMM